MQWRNNEFSLEIIVKKIFKQTIKFKSKSIKSTKELNDFDVSNLSQEML